MTLLYDFALLSVSPLEWRPAIFCIRCGTELPDISRFCRKCGHPVGRGVPATLSTTVSAAAAPAPVSVAEPVSQAAKDQAIAAKLTPSAERYFLRTEDGVTVTNSRFIVPGGTYAMANVASVKFGTKEPSRKGPLLMILAGVLCLLVGMSLTVSGLAVLGIIMIIGGVLWAALQKPTFSVILSSASGELQALTSNNAEYIQSVINALNEAIIHRG